MSVRTQYAGYLLSGTGVASGVGGSALDVRFARNYAYLQYAVPGASALVTVQASVDGAGWMDVQMVTATTTTGTAQLAGYFPFVRAITNAIYSAGGNTGYPVIYFAGGMN